MKIYLGVENYGKIEQAEITLGDLIIFVGNNNSGKTLMMQLIYGVLKELTTSYNAKNVQGFIAKGNSIQFGKEWFDNLERDINQYLLENKEVIVQKTFHNQIEIGRLYIRIEHDEDSYICRCNEEILEFPAGLQENRDNEHRFSHVSYYSKRGAGEEEQIAISLFAAPITKTDLMERVLKRMVCFVLDIGFREDELFLPASRTGMLLLYKSFFAEKSKMEEEILIDRFQMRKQKNELGLTEPVYDFLRFLLQYQPNQEKLKQNASLLEFLETRLIDGKIENWGDEVYYRPKKYEKQIPLYMSSSLVNELAPLTRLLSAAKDYRYIFYDEIETCIHPLKQGELARLIIRMVNHGMKMIVSTHSDTMAVKLNNLLVLANKYRMQSDIEKLLKELGLEHSDILMKQSVHVYQFRNMEDGSSHVEELECVSEPGIGYEFGLFMENLDQMYAETEIIMR